MALGLLTPFGAGAVLAAMIVAMFSVHVKNGFWAMKNGIEMPFLYAVAALGLAFTGGGHFSFEALLGFEFQNQPAVVEGILVLALLGAAATIALRKQPGAQASAAHS